MSSTPSLALLASQVKALRKAMEAVMNSNTPDHGKWTSVNIFIGKYCSLARQYQTVTGNTTIPIYDLNKLKSPYNMIWSMQKSHFESIYADTLMLEAMLELTESHSHGPLYNLFVSGNSDNWNGEPFEIELSRCLREYTTPGLTAKFGNFDLVAVNELKKLPSVFAYESSCNLAPRFGYIRNIKARRDKVKIEYDLKPVDPFLTAKELEEMSFDLDIGKLELFRTHWALKEVNLLKELHAKVKAPR